MAVAGNNDRDAVMEGWKNRLVNSFADVFKFNHEQSSDAYVLVGSHRIFVHQTVLKLTSKIIEGCSEGSFDKSCGKLELEILPEFSDEEELVLNIVKSLYTGTIIINQGNMRMIYKFSKCYSIQWLLDFTLPMILDTMDSKNCENFIDVFKFAHIVWCTNLMTGCIERLDSDMAEKLIGSGLLFQLDFYCIRTITLSVSVYLPELKVFELVYKWCDGDLELRACHIPDLLTPIHYHLIDKASLTDQILNWILNVSGVEEKARVRLLVAVTEGMKSSVVVNRARSLPPHTSADVNHNTLTAESDPVLSKIVNELPSEMTTEELNSVITEKFRCTDNNTQHCILDYISKHKKLTENNITSYLKLFQISQQGRVMWCCIDYVLYSGGDESYNIDHIDWRQIPYSTISEILTNESVQALLREYDLNTKGNVRYTDGDKQQATCMHGQRFYGATNTELVMLWAQAHPKEKANMTELLKRLCYLSMPLGYKQEILLPHIQRLLPDVTHLACTTHKAHTDTWAVPEPLTKPAPIEVYTMQTFTSTAAVKSGSALKIYFNKNNMSKLELYHSFNDYAYMYRSGDNCYRTKHILFDRSMHVTEFPLLRSFDSAKHLQRMVEKSGYLHLMMFPPDNRAGWELFNRPNYN